MYKCLHPLYTLHFCALFSAFVISQTQCDIFEDSCKISANGHLIPRLRKDRQNNYLLSCNYVYMNLVYVLPTANFALPGCDGTVDVCNLWSLVAEHSISYCMRYDYLSYTTLAMVEREPSLGLVTWRYVIHLWVDFIKHYLVYVGSFFIKLHIYVLIDVRNVSVRAYGRENEKKISHSGETQ